jgi:hypothetical protein
MNKLKYTDGFNINDFDDCDAIGILTNARPFTKKELKFLRKAYKKAAKNHEVAGIFL